MNVVKYLGIAALAATSIAAAMTIASAQSGRDDAIHKCIQQARASFPDSGGADASQDANRSAFYKSCMTREGFTP